MRRDRELGPKAEERFERGLDSFWVGLGPDDSPLVLRDLGGYQLYSLELDEGWRDEGWRAAF